MTSANVLTTINSLLRSLRSGRVLADPAARVSGVAAFRSEWLNLTKEEIIDPKRPIIDPHLHLFKNSAFFPRYSLDDFWADAAGHNVKQAVFVQCLEGYREDG